MNLAFLGFGTMRVALAHYIHEAIDCRAKTPAGKIESTYKEAVAKMVFFTRRSGLLLSVTGLVEQT